MTLTEAQRFLASLYLGDRACKGISVDTWKNTARIVIDSISRVRSPDGAWDYYTAEGIEDGRLVFTGVSRFGISPPGPLPNDYIVEYLARDVDLNGSVLFEFHIGAVSAGGESTKLILLIAAEDIYLEDPMHPDAVIR